jgi:HD-GYP domain-containing protein (c-di-GMP phosphodiesterase class II)
MSTENEHIDHQEAEDQSVGHAMLTTLLGAVRTLQIYPVGNQTTDTAITDLETRAAETMAREGGLSVWVAGSFIFVNDLRMRLDRADHENFGVLRQLLAGHGIGRIDVKPGVTREEWISFLSALGEQGAQAGEPGGDALGDFEQGMEAASVKRIDVGPPAALFDHLKAEDQERESARRTYVQSVSVVRDSMSGAVLGQPTAARKAKRAILGIVDEVLQDKASMLGMTTMRDYDDPTFLHSVNVAILSVALGETLEMTKPQLFDLGFCALFHDIGKLLIPGALLNKTGWLNDQDWQQLAQHPDFGLLMMFDVEGFAEPPYRAMLAAYEHHMKVDLSGYPKAIRPRQIGYFAKIIAVAEAYDAAITGRTGGFMPCSPDEAVRQLWENTSSGWDRVVVKAFINMMGIYPVGTAVILDDGSVAMVVARNPDERALHRPVVKVVVDGNGQKLGADGALIDLMAADPATGEAQYYVARTTDPQRYGIKSANYLA